MRILKYLLLSLILLAGCDDRFDPIENKVVRLTDRDIGEKRYMSEIAIYRTDDMEWLCITTATQFTTGTHNDITVGSTICYSAQQHSFFDDDWGFRQIIYFVDKVTIIEP